MSGERIVNTWGSRPRMQAPPALKLGYCVQHSRSPQFSAGFRSDDTRTLGTSRVASWDRRCRPDARPVDRASGGAGSSSGTSPVRPASPSPRWADYARHNRHGNLLSPGQWCPRTLGELVRHLSACGDTVQLIHPDYGPPHEADNRSHTVRSIVLPFYKEIHLPLPPFGSAHRAIASFGPDVVHIATEATLGLSVLKCAMRAG